MVDEKAVSKTSVTNQPAQRGDYGQNPPYVGGGLRPAVDCNRLVMVMVVQNPACSFSYPRYAVSHLNGSRGPDIILDT